MTQYNSWPLGELPKEVRRPEPDIIKAMGYSWEDPRDIIEIFENKVAEFAGARYAVAVDCCTHAIELCLRFRKFPELWDFGLPENTYHSVYQVFEKIGLKRPALLPIKWVDKYRIEGTNIIDAATLWRSGMYEPGRLFCISFQIKKRVPIGRGGMILTDNEAARDWLRLARYDGRDMSLPYDHPDHVKGMGFHYYMTPEDAARGIYLMDRKPEEGGASWINYPKIKK